MAHTGLRVHVFRRIGNSSRLARRQRSSKRPVGTSQRAGLHASMIGARLVFYNRSPTFQVDMAESPVLPSGTPAGQPKRNRGTYYMATLLFKIYFKVIQT